MNIHYINQERYVGFQISTFLGSALTPGFTRASSKESKRTLVVPERSLDGFSRVTSKESKRTLVVLERSLDGF